MCACVHACVLCVGVCVRALVCVWVHICAFACWSVSQSSALLVRGSMPIAAIESADQVQAAEG
jgi:hypothetical protein